MPLAPLHSTRGRIAVAAFLLLGVVTLIPGGEPRAAALGLKVRAPSAQAWHR